MELVLETSKYSELEHFKKLFLHKLSPQSYIYGDIVILSAQFLSFQIFSLRPTLIFTASLSSVHARENRGNYFFTQALRTIL